MKLSTKTLGSVLIATIVNATPSKRRICTQRGREKYERVVQKHDRKGELRASVLGIEPTEFRDREKKHSLAQIVKSCGFTDERSYYRALAAKVKDELRKRGWTSYRMDEFVLTRLTRPI